VRRLTSYRDAHRASHSRHSFDHSIATMMQLDRARYSLRQSCIRDWVGKDESQTHVSELYLHDGSFEVLSVYGRRCGPSPVARRAASPRLQFICSGNAIRRRR